MASNGLLAPNALEARLGLYKSAQPGSGFLNADRNPFPLRSRLTNSPLANLLKSGFAGFAGAAGDIQGLLGGSGLPTSDDMASAIGADLDRPSGLLGLLGAPDPSDIPRLMAGGKGLLGAMTLFHGTPHKFEKFDLSKIGTGEGAQAYGHGLYFAENPEVAGSYRESLSDFDIFVGGEKVDLSSSTDEAAILDVLKARAGRDGLRSNSIPEDTIRNLRDYFIEAGQSEDLATLDRLVDKGISVKQSGHLYEIDYPDHLVENMLDWDAPLSEQPEILKKIVREKYPEHYDKIEKVSSLQTNIERLADKYAKPGDSYADAIRRSPADIQKKWKGMVDEYNYLNNVLTDEIRSGFVPTDGQGLYRMMGTDFGSEEEASRFLNSQGIPGIRFWDGNSRRAGEGTRNIVVFNPDDITSVKRDGELVWENRLGIK